MGFFGTSRGKRAVGESNNDSTVYVNMEQQQNSDVPVAVPIDAAFAKDDPVATHNPTPATTAWPAPQLQKQQATTSQHHLGVRNHLVFVQRSPVVMDACPYCGGVNVPTRTVARPDIWTLGAVVLILIVFWPLFWVPLVLNMCKTVVHYCSSCGAQVGRVPAFQDFCVQETPARL